ncbi:hypothetical protein [Streptomyces sp. MAI_2237]
MPGLFDSLSEEQRGLLRTSRSGTDIAARPMPATLSDRREFSEAGEWDSA